MLNVKCDKLTRHVICVLKNKALCSGIFTGLEQLVSVYLGLHGKMKKKFLDCNIMTFMIFSVYFLPGHTDIKTVCLCHFVTAFIKDVISPVFKITLFLR